MAPLVRLLLFAILGCSFGLDPNLQKTNQACTTDLSCNDGNPLTIDKCDDEEGLCEYTCDDRNACTKEAFVDGHCQPVNEHGLPDECSHADGCVPGLITCNDNNFFTTDVCSPSKGCLYLRWTDYADDLDGQGLVRLNAALEEVSNEASYFYEENTSLSPTQTNRILEWLKLEMTQLRTPYCWKRSYGRGAGEAVGTCPPGTEQIGALCYTPCPSGFYRWGVDCHQHCKAGWTQQGAFCRLEEYGRGGGYPWQGGDWLFKLDQARDRCERDNGRGNCEQNGLLYYPKCRNGYYAFGCCICRPNAFSCRNEGYSDVQLDLSCGKKIILGDPKPMWCSADQEQDPITAICYPKCSAGYYGVGPVCWQSCDTDQWGCGAACTLDESSCQQGVFNQVLAPLMLAANIATMGASKTATSAAKTAQVAGKTYWYSKKVGQSMLWLGQQLGKVASSTQKIRKVVRGTVILIDAATVATAVVTREFASEFIDQTSYEIAHTVLDNLNPVDVIYIQRVWAEAQFYQLAAAEGWNTARVALSGVALVDPSGVFDVVAAYTKPVCSEIFGFPVCTNAISTTCSTGGALTIDRNDAPNAKCRDIQAPVSSAAACGAARVSAASIDNRSSDPNGDSLTFSLEPSGPFSIEYSPHEVTMTVADSYGKFSTCSAKIEVVSATSSITCPPDVHVSADAGECGANVVYEKPFLAECSTSTIEQIAGGASGTFFVVGSTLNTFKKTDSLGITEECSFYVVVVDDEAPKISCRGLDTILWPGDVSSCDATYSYEAPTATDNCPGAFTVRTQGPDINPEAFPMGKSAVEYTAVDSAGNLASCTFAVVVERPVNNTCPDAAVKGACCRPSEGPSDQQWCSDCDTPMTLSACKKDSKYSHFLEFIPEKKCKSLGTAADGDPHVKTWTGKWFDYNGECDLVLMHIDDFEGLGAMTVYIRTKIRYLYSFISNAVLRIGNDTLEVASWGDYYVNGVGGGTLDSISGYTIEHSHPNEKQHLFKIIIGHDETIQLATFKDLVSVRIDGGSADHFNKTVGLMGTFGGKKLARDGKSIMEDEVAFGQEWQVLPQEDTLFVHPRPPGKCKLPSATIKEARHLRSAASRETAEKACAQQHTNKDAMEACVLDVMLTGDVDIAKAGGYN